MSLRTKHRAKPESATREFKPLTLPPMKKQYLCLTFCYRISLVIRQSFLFLPKHPKNLDPSYKMDLDLKDCLGRVKLVLVAKFHRTDSVICSHSREGKTSSYSQVVKVIKDETNKTCP